MKTCTKCQTPKPESDFPKDKRGKAGLSSRCRGCTSAKDKARYERDGERIRTRVRDYQRDRGRALRLETIQHYGGCCACCTEDKLEFLAIDHIDGGGCEHRRQLGMKSGGVRFYAWLKRQGWPEGYRVLCHNCNTAMGLYGRCPHED